MHFCNAISATTIVSSIVTVWSIMSPRINATSKTHAVIRVEFNDESLVEDSLRLCRRGENTIKLEALDTSRSTCSADGRCKSCLSSLELFFALFWSSHHNSDHQVNSYQKVRDQLNLDQGKLQQELHREPPCQRQSWNRQVGRS